MVAYSLIWDEGGLSPVTTLNEKWSGRSDTLDKFLGKDNDVGLSFDL